MTESEFLGYLSQIGPRGATVSSITRMLGGWPTVDGRDVRHQLDQLVATGRAVYLEGNGNNRRYRLSDQVAS